jgi:adenylate cyclase
MESPILYIPMDRRQAIARGKDLPDRASGAALFADISGFTPLTEALMKELGAGRGAEELTRQLNAVYDALIAEVHRYGGSVIGFSGDAITCWFDGNDGLQATACALAMQQVMEQFARVRVRSSVRVSLAIKVAVAAGSVRRFLVGDPEIQVIDVLAGATLDRLARAEKLANSGEVVLGPAAMSQLDNKVECISRRGLFAVVSGLTCHVDATPWPDILFSPGEGTEEGLRSWLLPPVYERLEVGQGQFMAELRPVVAFFLKFGGLDYDQDDAAGEKLDAYIRWVQGVLGRHESYLIQLTIGDKGSFMYAAFGAPLTHDDDPAGAVAAAVELRSPPPEMDFITNVQIGISQGRMRVGAYGGSMRRTYGAIGDETNVAARLMGKAKPGQILISERVAISAVKSYRFEFLGEVELKGKKGPLPVYRPSGRRPPSPQRPTTVFVTSLVGRNDELARMERVLDAVQAGEGQVLRLEGVAGVGKSRLAAEFVERAKGRGLRVAMGACQSISRGIAYTPWRQAFRALFGLTEESIGGEDAASLTVRQVARLKAMVNAMNPQWLVRLPLLGDLLDLPIPDNETTVAFAPELRQESLFALVVEIVQFWANARPLLVLIEDAHWMDEASQGLTLALRYAVTHASVLLTLVHRPPVREKGPLLPDLERWPRYNLIELQELSPQGVEELVANRLQGKPSALALSLVQAMAQGNPFFTEELVDTLHESGSLCRQGEKGDGATWTLSEPMFNSLREADCLAQEGGQWVLATDARLSVADLGIPDSIHGIVLTRIDRLPEPHKLTLKAASVIGRVFEFDLLAGSHPAQPDPQVLLEQMELLKARNFTWLETPQPRLTYTFKHNITQDVVYQTLLEEQQRELHQAVGETLESLQPEALERLAFHYRHSGVRDKALLYLDKAARKTQREYANETALNYYSRALALEERWEWRKGQVEVLHILGRRDEEQAALQALGAISEAPVFDVAYLWGQYHEETGDYVQAQAAVERALATSRGQSDVAGEIHCLDRLGSIMWRQGQYDEAKARYLQASALLQDKETYSDEETRAFTQVLNGLGTIHRQQGQFDEARECYEQALELDRMSGNRMGEARALSNLGSTAFYRRNFAESLAYHRQALEMRRVIGDRVGEGTSLFNLALATRDAGDYGRALEYLSATLNIHQAVGNRWEEVNVWNDLGILYHELGDWSQAQSCLLRGLALAQEINDEAGQAYLLVNLGLVACDSGDLATAERQLADGLSLAQKQDDKRLVSSFLSYMSMASLRAGRLEQAVERATKALTLRQELDMRWNTADNLATIAAARLATGDNKQALGHAEEALIILGECGGEGPEFPQRDYFLCYQVLKATGQKEAARVALQSAYSLVTVRTDKITDPDLRHSFLEKVSVNQEIVQEHRNVMRET